MRLIDKLKHTYNPLTHTSYSWPVGHQQTMTVAPKNLAAALTQIQNDGYRIGTFEHIRGKGWVIRYFAATND